MARQSIDTVGTGDTLPSAFGKLNTMSGELYAGRVSGTGRIILLGDSITAQHNVQETPAQITRSGSTATAIITVDGLVGGAGVNFPDQTLVYGMRASDDAYNGFKVLTRVDTKTYTFPVTGSPATPATPGGAGSFSVSVLSRPADRGWFNWGNMFLGWPFQIVHNAAMGGERTTALDGHITLDVLPYDADWVLVSYGINDIVADVSAATIVANLTAGCARLLADGRKVLLTTLVPLHNGSASYTLARAHAVMAVNRALIDYARATPGIYLADLYGPMIDPTQSVMTIKSGYGDGIHPYAIGGHAIGRAFANDFADVFPTQLGLPQSAVEDWTVNNTERQICKNPMFLGTGGTLSGGPTGTVADDWTLLQSGTLTVVGSVAARADGYGNDQVITCSAGTGTSNVYLYNSTNLVGRATNGDRIFTIVEVTVSGLTALRSIQSTIQSNVAGAATVMGAGLTADSTTYPQGDMTILLRSPTVTIPPGTITNLNHQIQVAFNTGGAGVIKVGRMALYKES